MAAKVKRSENLLTRIADRTGMTDAGKEWIISALDPFHDNPINVLGYPDGSVSKNIVQVIKQSQVITAPPNCTVNWDCQIVQWPWVNATALVNAVADITVSGAINPGLAPNSMFGCEVSGTATPQLAGGLTAWTCPAGGDMSIASVANGMTGTPTYASSQLVLPPVYQVGKRRIIAAGFEVYNTSAQLYRGGTVCVYRSPVEDVDTANVMMEAVTDASLSLQQIVPAKTIVMEAPPANSGAALLLPYSRQWDAENGCYVVGAVNSVELAPHNDMSLVPFITDNSSPVTKNTYTTNPVIITMNNIGWSSPFSFATPVGLQVNQMDLAGAYFTGLANQSSLTINWTLYLERFPSFDDKDLVVLAKPPPERDDIALRFYSHAVNQLPTGVPVKENGLGDWFADAIGTASDFIAPVLSAIPHPAAQGMGMVLKGANAVINKDRIPQGLVPSNARTPRQEAATVAVKNKNAFIREKNIAVRAKNAEIRARKALKAEKKVIKKIK